jgi:hypothetical protein
MERPYVFVDAEDWRFSFEFKDACKEEIREHCVVCTSKHAEDCKVY